MSDVIDSLLIDIQAQSKNVDERLEYISVALGEMADAVSSIDTTKMTALATGLSQISQSVRGLSSINKKTMDAFAQRMTSISSINTAGLNNVATTFATMGASMQSIGDISQNVANITNLASAIAKLGGVKVTQAVQNIPALSASLYRMMQVFANAPYVSDNTIRMVQAFSQLASQGQKVSSATKAITNGLKEVDKQAQKTENKVNSLIDSFNKIMTAVHYIKGVIYAFKRAVSKIWENADLSMDYVEIYNYWNVVTDKIAKEAEQKGTEAGKNYAEAFTDQLKTLTKKMSGYSLGKKGELVQTGEIGLGMDASKVMQYQAQIMGITNAVGMLEETSVKTSKALSMLAGDLSSLTNQDLDTVMTNLRSGLIGMSRSLYKYGIDITNNTLAQYALANGISKSVSEMSQSEKMYLRMIAILDQSKVAWGDQANTINSVANQYRIMKQQLQNLARTIGNLFLPIIQKVLPYINGFIIAMQRLLSLLGFKIYGGNWLKDLQDGISGGASALDGMEEDAEGLGDALDDAGKSAKKLKSNLLGIDELNVLSQEDNSGSSKWSGADISGGLADALDFAIEDYEAVWNDAFEKMKNKAEEIADKIMAWFEKIGRSQFWKNIKDLAKLLKEIAGYAFTGLKDFWNDFLKPVASWLGNKVLKELLDILKGFVKAIKWDKLRNAFKALWQVLAKFTIGIGQGLIDFLAHVANVALQAIAVGINAVATALEFVAKILNKIPTSVLIAIGGALGGILTVVLAYKVAPAIIGAFETALLNLLYLKDGIVHFFGMLASLDPVIIAVAGVVTVLGALYAVTKECHDEMVAMQGMNIIESLQGDTSISEFATEVFEGFTKIAEGIEKYSGKAQELIDANQELETAKEDLGGIFRLIDENRDIGSAIDDLCEQFQNLYHSAHENFTKAYLYVQAFLHDAWDDASTEELKSKIKSYEDTVENFFTKGNEQFNKYEGEINDIVEALSKNEIETAEAVKRIAEINSEVHFLDSNAPQEYEDAVNKINNATVKLDFSKLSNADGSLNIDAYTAELDKIFAEIPTLESVVTEFERVEEANRQALSTLGVPPELQEEIIEMTSGKKEAIAEYETAITNLVNTMQTQLGDRLPDVMSKAGSDWDKANFFEQYINNFSGDDYVASAVTRFQTSFVDPFASETERYLNENLGVKGKTWVSDATKEMFSAVSSYDPDNELNNWHIDEDFRSKLKTASESIYPDAQEAGRFTTKGVADGITDAQSMQTITDATNKLATEGVLNAFNTAMNIHSPSQEMYDRGGYVVEGLNSGIEKNMSSTKEVIFSWAKFIKDTFDAKMPEFRAIGVNIGQGIANGLASATGEINRVVNDIANGIRNSFQISMEIHSPSRVMYRLGQYTVEGLKDGMESLYDATTRSFEKFSNGIVSAPTQMAYNVSGAVTKGNSRYASQTVNSDQTESVLVNALVPYLAQIMNNTKATADKDFSLQIGDREIARANARGQALMGATLIV